MANVTTLKAGGTGAGYSGQNGDGIFKHEINIADAVAAGLATTEQVKVADVPADSFFELLQVENATALDLDSGSSQQIDVGDGTDDDEFVAAATTEAAGTNHTIAKQTFTGGQVISSADAIWLKLTGDKLAGGTADATGIIRFVWKQYDTGRNAAMATATL